jgi:hypothetical protein
LKVAIPSGPNTTASSSNVNDCAASFADAALIAK